MLVLWCSAARMPRALRSSALRMAPLLSTCCIGLGTWTLLPWQPADTSLVSALYTTIPHGRKVPPHTQRIFFKGQGERSM